MTIIYVLIPRKLGTLGASMIIVIVVRINALA